MESRIQGCLGFPCMRGNSPLISASNIVFGRWNSKYMHRQNLVVLVQWRIKGKGWEVPGPPLISGSGWLLPRPPLPYEKVSIRHCSRIYNFTFNNSSFSTIRAYFCQGKCNLWLGISISSSLLFSCRFIRYIWLIRWFPNAHLQRFHNSSCVCQTILSTL